MFFLADVDRWVGSESVAPVRLARTGRAQTEVPLLEIFPTDSSKLSFVTLAPPPPQRFWPGRSAGETPLVPNPVDAPLPVVQPRDATLARRIHASPRSPERVTHSLRVDPGVTDVDDSLAWLPLLVRQTAPTAPSTAAREHTPAVPSSEPPPPVPPLSERGDMAMPPRQSRLGRASSGGEVEEALWLVRDWVDCDLIRAIGPSQSRRPALARPESWPVAGDAAAELAAPAWSAIMASPRSPAVAGRRTDSEPELEAQRLATVEMLAWAGAVVSPTRRLAHGRDALALAQQEDGSAVSPPGWTAVLASPAREMGRPPGTPEAMSLIETIEQPWEFAALASESATWRRSPARGRAGVVEAQVILAGIVQIETDQSGWRHGGAVMARADGRPGRSTVDDSSVIRAGIVQIELEQSGWRHGGSVVARASPRTDHRAERGADPWHNYAEASAPSPVILCQSVWPARGEWSQQRSSGELVLTRDLAEPSPAVCYQQVAAARVRGQEPAPHQEFSAPDWHGAGLVIYTGLGYCVTGDVFVAGAVAGNVVRE